MIINGTTYEPESFEIYEETSRVFENNAIRTYKEILIVSERNVEMPNFLPKMATIKVGRETFDNMKLYDEGENEFSYRKEHEVTEPWQ